MMELFALVGFVVLVAVIVIGINLYRRPDWTRRKLGNLMEKWK